MYATIASVLAIPACYRGVIIGENPTSIVLHQRTLIQKIIHTFQKIDTLSLEYPLLQTHLLYDAVITSKVLGRDAIRNGRCTKVPGLLQFLRMRKPPDLATAVSLLEKFGSHSLSQNYLCPKKMVQWVISTVNYGLELNQTFRWSIDLI